MEKAQEAGSHPNLSLLDYQNTPVEGVGNSPFQWLFGRRTRTLLPTSSRLLVPENFQGVPYKLKDRKAKQTYYYDRGAKELSKLEPVVVVRIKPDRDSKRWAKATVDKEVDIRSHQVRTEDGRTYRRNRRYLRLTKELFFRVPTSSVSKPTRPILPRGWPSKLSCTYFCQYGGFRWSHCRPVRTKTKQWTCFQIQWYRFSSCFCYLYACGYCGDNQKRPSGSEATKIWLLISALIVHLFFFPSRLFVVFCFVSFLLIIIASLFIVLFSF